MSHFLSGRRGFTVPELLIALALIVLLVAVALPGFREAQTRSKISSARSDMRRLAVALEGYRIDYRVYPKCNNYGLSAARFSPAEKAYPRFWVLERLSTPVAYVEESLLSDPFDPSMRTGTVGPETGYFTPTPLEGDPNIEIMALYKYITPGPTGMQDVESPSDIASSYFALSAAGPDRIYENMGGLLIPSATDPAILAHVYDPTNGTFSAGSLFRVGGDSTGEGNFGARFFDRVGRWAE